MCTNHEVSLGAKQNLHASSYLILHNKHKVQEVQGGAPGKAQTLTSQSFEFQT
jgi:hypothetical protein